MSQITVRPKNFDFPEQIDRYWCGNNLFKTHFFNSITLLFPDGERFMLWAIKSKLQQINDPQLKQEMMSFIGQEAQHAQQHEKFWHNLRQQGYEFDTYLRFLKFFLFNICKNRLNTKFQLAMVAGVENFTSVVAELILEEDLFSDSDSKLRELFEWHSAEEIEHKTVAYDVFQTTTKSYLIRLLGMIIAYVFVLGFIGLGLFMMLYQDKKLLNFRMWQEMAQFLLIKEKFAFRVILKSLEYLRINFHPSQKDNLFLVSKVIT
jgi:uncharacterized protein